MDLGNHVYPLEGFEWPWLIWGMAMIVWNSWNKNEVAMRGCSWTWNSVVSPGVSPGHLEWSYWSRRLSLV